MAIQSCHCVRYMAMESICQHIFSVTIYLNLEEMSVLDLINL